MSNDLNQHRKMIAGLLTTKKIIFLFAILFAMCLNNGHAQNTWTKKADFGGTARWGAVGFSIGSNGYVGTGTDDAVNGRRDFWKFDPANNVWTQKANFGGVGRYAAVGFSIGSKGYIGTGIGENGSTIFKDFWEYDPATNVWTQKKDFGGEERFRAVGFSIEGKGYIGTGLSKYDTVLKIFGNMIPELTPGRRKLT
jgi:N-acetylneuraminic acid mutarotase